MFSTLDGSNNNFNKYAFSSQWNAWDTSQNQELMQNNAAIAFSPPATQGRLSTTPGNEEETRLPKEQVIFEALKPQMDANNEWRSRSPTPSRLEIMFKAGPETNIATIVAALRAISPKQVYSDVWIHKGDASILLSAPPSSTSPVSFDPPEPPIARSRSQSAQPIPQLSELSPIRPSTAPPTRSARSNSRHVFIGNEPEINLLPTPERFSSELAGFIKEGSLSMQRYRSGGVKFTFTILDPDTYDNLCEQAQTILPTSHRLRITGDESTQRITLTMRPLSPFNTIEMTPIERYFSSGVLEELPDNTCMQTPDDQHFTFEHIDKSCCSSQSMIVKKKSNQLTVNRQSNPSFELLITTLSSYIGEKTQMVRTMLNDGACELTIKNCAKTPRIIDLSKTIRPILSKNTHFFTTVEKMQVTIKILNPSNIESAFVSGDPTIGFQPTTK